MKSQDLNSMSAAALIDLRNGIDRVLAAKVSAERRELQAKLDKLDQYGGKGRGAKGRSHPLKGGKVAPRYRGPEGETWSGRGLRPKWMTALIAQGHKPEEFAIDAPGAGKGTRKRARRGRK